MPTNKRLRIALCALFLSVASQHSLAAPQGMLETLHRHKFLSSTITDNGDENPYAVVVVPRDMGILKQGDVLVDNFNNISNLQGTGSSIVRYSPTSGKTTLFAQLPQHMKECPGGIGLSTAMAILNSGWIIVGSTPSTDGTTATKGDGCLLVFDANGKLVETWADRFINDPWGNISWQEQNNHATLFISMAGFGLPGPDVLDPATQLPVVKHQATVLRLNLDIQDGKPPVIAHETVIGDHYAQRADRDNFLFGPTGTALGKDDTLYVTDGLENAIYAIDHASTRTGAQGTGRLLTQNGLLAWPLAMVITPQQHLIVLNGKNGQAVEVDAASGKQIYAHWLNTDQAQSPPGNGDLFGAALTPDGTGLYYIEDDINALALGAAK